jgi:PAS domain S-box-containing protein
MINGVLVAFSCASPIMLGISLTRAFQHGWQLIYAIHCLIALTTIFGAVFRKRLSYRIRVSLFLGIAFVLGATGLPAFGLVGGGHIILMLFSILATIGFGTRTGLIATLINVILMIIVAIAVCTGKWVFAFDISKYATSPSAWAAVIVDFILIVPMAVLAIGSVYSQLQKTLQGVKESHAAHQRLANNLTNSFLYRYTEGGKIEYASSVEQILGYHREEFFNLRDLLTDHPDNEGSLYIDHLEDHEGKRAPFEIQVYHKNGSKRWLHLSETVVQTPSGIKVEGVAHDITQRVIREMAIENILTAFTAKPGKEFFDDMIIQLARTLHCDAAFFGHLSKDDKQVVQTDAFYNNGQLSENFEYNMAGTPCEQMVVYTSYVVPAGICEIFPAAEMLREMQIEGYAGIPLADKNGNQIGVLVALWKERTFDESLITPVFKLFSEYAVIEMERQSEEKKHALLEEQLRQSQKMDAVGQLAGGIAHDFNNMLMGIMGASDLLKMRLGDDAEAQEYHEMIRSSSKRAADLTRQLLTFARKQPIGNTQFDVHETIWNAVDLLKSTLDRRIDIQADLQARRHSIIGDSTQLQNAVMNLGINAAHAMPNGGRISICTRLVEHSGNTESCIEIIVRDEGCGIEEENLNKIFDPFFTTKPLGKGTGLGLSAVLGTVQQHRGNITVENNPEKGTSFRIHLPLSDSNCTGNVGKEQLAPGLGRILLIDDEPIIQATMSRTLNQLGYQVTVADNGKQGLQQFKEMKGAFDLVILDMVMPEMNGRDCFFGLKKIDPQVRVILSTGYANDQDIQEMRSAGLFATLAKPFSSARLSQVILQALSKPRGFPRRSV